MFEDRILDVINNYRHLHFIPVEKQLVHKSNTENVFLSDIAQFATDEDKAERFICNMHVHANHPFFFEHERNHVPGLYLILGVALCQRSLISLSSIVQALVAITIFLN
jgi:hypothetical protein